LPRKKGKSMKEQRCILAVLAHPDDESFGMGGTLAYYARQGVMVRLICATRGEVGEVEPDLLKGYQSIAELREHELRCAAAKLSLTSVDFLGYRDSGMRGTKENNDPRSLFQAPLDEVAKKIAALMRKYQPQIVLTFDPAGGYYHPDHVKVHQATVRAFSLAGDPNVKIADTKPFSPRKLYFHTMPHGVFKLAVKIMPLLGMNPHEFGKNKDIDLTEIVGTDFPTHARINYRSAAKYRDEAAACHASQGGGSNSWLQWLQRYVFSSDTFMRAIPEAQNDPIEKDLFEGI